MRIDPPTDLDDAEDWAEHAADFKVEMAGTVRYIGLAAMLVLPVGMMAPTLKLMGWWAVPVVLGIWTVAWFTVGRVLWALQDLAIEDNRQQAVLRRYRVIEAEKELAEDDWSLIKAAKAIQETAEAEQGRLAHIAELQELRRELDG